MYSTDSLREHPPSWSFQSFPLQFEPGEGWRELGLDGTEEFSILDINDGLSVRKKLNVTAKKTDGTEVNFIVTARIDTEVELQYYKFGGILQYVLFQLLD